MAEPVSNDSGGDSKPPDKAGDTETTSTKTRWRFTGTLAAMLLVLTSCAVVLVHVYRGANAPLWATSTFGLATLAAVAWTFGEAALKAAKAPKK